MTPSRVVLRTICRDLGLSHPAEARVQRFAFEAFKRGLTARQLGSEYTDDDWNRLRRLANDEHAPNLVCAGAADYLAHLERTLL